MKKAFTIFFLLGCCIASFGQVEVSGSIIGNTPANYTTLGNAFNAVNNGIHTGDVSIKIYGNTNEPSTARLYPSGYSGTSSYTTVRIEPSGGFVRTISGNIPDSTATIGGSLVALVGADNVTIDGLNTGGNALVFLNRSISSRNRTSTLKIFDDSKNVTIIRCSILGKATGGSTSGVLLVGTATNPAVNSNGGCDNLRIAFCNIGAPADTVVHRAIYIEGSAGDGSRSNEVKVEDNNIFDFFSNVNSSNGIFLNGTADNFTLQRNRFYQTKPRTLGVSGAHYVIAIANSAGNPINTIVLDNIIGYSDEFGRGMYTITLTGQTVTPRILFVPIYIFNGGSGMPTTSKTSVDGNIITNIAVDGSAYNLSTDPGALQPFMGITVVAGFAEIGTGKGNIIGAIDRQNAITITSTANAPPTTRQLEFSAIAHRSSNATALAIVENNSIGGITMSATNIPVVFNAVSKGLSASDLVVKNNVIGGIVANSIQITSTNAENKIYGVFSTGLDLNFTATNNIIRNMTNAGGGNGTALDAGIFFQNPTLTSSKTVSISNNSIYNLRNISATGVTSIYGIYISPPSGSCLSNNIYDLSVASSNATARITGIRFERAAIVRNNMVRLGAGITNAVDISGLRFESGTTSNMQHNSVLIQGTALDGSTSTFAFNGNSTSTRDYRNNIFANTRSNTTGAATARHCAIRIGSNSGLTSNYNLYYANGLGGVLGRFGATDQISLANWQTSTGGDANSFNVDPLFKSSTDLHLSLTSPALNTGINLSITNDLDADTRVTPPEIGADEYNDCDIALVGGTSSLVQSNLCGSGATILRASGYNSFKDDIGYQWQYSNDNFVSNIVNLAGANDPSIATTNTLTNAGTMPLVEYYRLRVSCLINSAESFSNIVPFTVNPLPTASITPGSAAICDGDAYTLTANTNIGDAYQWQNNNVNILGEVGPSFAATTAGNYSVVIRRTSTGCNTFSSAVAITTTPLGTTLAGTPGKSLLKTEAIADNGTIFSTNPNDCFPIAKIEPAGVNSINGQTNVTVTLDPIGANPTFNTEPYVARHFDIWPVNNTPNYTGVVTLYFTDAEFVDFNTRRSQFPALPTVAGGGNADPQINRLRVTRYAGQPTVSPSLPNQYSIATAPERLVPNSVFYNGSNWEVRVPFSGMGGFYLHTNGSFLLPIAINYISGQKIANTNKLTWKVTCQSAPEVTMELQRSSDGVNFTTIHTETASAARCEQPFEFTDVYTLSGRNYYRLKLKDINEKNGLSNVVLLLQGTKGFVLQHVAPNPVEDKINIVASAATSGSYKIGVYDLEGRLLQVASVRANTGQNIFELPCSNLAVGSYLLKVWDNNNLTQGLLRFIKK